jgi:hypothetical protein
MLNMCEQLGFAISHDPDDLHVSVVKLSL